LNQREEITNHIKDMWRESGWSEEDIKFFETHTMEETARRFGLVRESPSEKRLRMIKKYKKLMPEIKSKDYNGKLVVADVTGFGGTYLRGIIAGLKYLKNADPEKDKIEIGEQTTIYNISSAKNNFTRGLFEAIEAINPDSPWEYFGSIQHSKMIWEYGYENWLKLGMRKYKRLLKTDVDEDIFNLFHSFVGFKELPETDFWDEFNKSLEEHKKWVRTFIKDVGYRPSCW